MSLRPYSVVPPVRRRVCRSGFGLALLVAMFWGMAVSVAPRVGVTADEPGHLTAGYSYWRYNDYRLNPENGTLPMRIAALPLVAMDLVFPSLQGDAWRRSSTVGVADEFFWAHENPVDLMVFGGRAAIAMMGGLVVALVWCWARGLFGRRAGWLAAGLATFCPALLAHSGLATSDATVTVCFLAAISAVWLVLHRVTWARLTLATLTCGALFLAKMSGVLLVPLFAAMLVARWLRRAPLVVELRRDKVRWLRGRGAIVAATSGVTLAVAAGSLALLWGGYGFRYEGFNRERSEARGYYFSWDVVLGKEAVPWQDDSTLTRFVTPRRAPAETTLGRVVAWLRDRRLLPEAFLWGFAHTLKFADERPAFFRGEFSKTGWAAFFPTAFVMKTPAPLLLLFVVGMAAAVIRGRRRWWYRAAPLLVFFAVYWALALNMRLNIGHRHILPTYPVVYVLGSAALLWSARAGGRVAGLAVATAAGLLVVESLAARPFYLAYFQPAFGGTSRAYQSFVDSSLDWGQGLPELAAWQGRRREAGDRASLFLSYAGVDLPARHGMTARRFGDEHYDLERRTYPAQLRGGWFGISATQFQRVYLPVRGPWTREHEALYGELNRRLAQGGNGLTDAAARAQRLRDARDYELLQFARLCHWLARRAPDEVVGASILMFRLTDAEVEQALYGPPPITSAVGRAR